jgi:hypothetical protein
MPEQKNKEETPGNYTVVSSLVERSFPDIVKICVPEASGRVME